MSAYYFKIILNHNSIFMIYYYGYLKKDYSLFLLNYVNNIYVTIACKFTFLSRQTANYRLY